MRLGALDPRRTWRSVLPGLLLALLPALAEPSGAATLRIGTSGDYAPFSVIAPGADADGATPEPQGLDPELARAFAKEHGYKIEWVTFRWPDLLRDLKAGRFDVAMSGVTMRPERSLAGVFTVPVAEAGAVVLAPAPVAADLHREGLRLAVNAGGHLEQVARALFPKAELRPIADNRAVRAALEAGDVDAVMTDSLEAPGWLEGHPEWHRVGPLSRDLKAWLVAKDHEDLARELDGWLLAHEADGSLGRIRARALGDPTAKRTARPAAALVAAIAERMALMPAVAEAKRRSGAPLRVPEREAELASAAVQVAREEGRRTQRPVPSDEAITHFEQALFDAAVGVEEAVQAGPAASGELPDLKESLRPALSRIGDRIARLLPWLPAGVAADAVDDDLSQLVDLPGLGPKRRRALADAMAELAAAPRVSAAGR